ncbi:hypothetical protein FH972_021226 [Carpinus fangiana]|uniref:DUF4185 domain-containing protein n=1 Tax=Carpinus fangiana TaxID=176857 RepID=A0A5N6KNT1_9ROSI|nr:hypothetical protein FH972_021226 [Carpinus fangiana]
MVAVEAGRYVFQLRLPDWARGILDAGRAQGMCSQGIPKVLVTRRAELVPLVVQVVWVVDASLQMITWAWSKAWWLTGLARPQYESRTTIMNKLFDKAKEQLDKFNQGGGGFPGQHHGGGGSLSRTPTRKAVYPYPGQGPQGPGDRTKVKAKHVEYHDRMQFYHPQGHPHDTLRDLGFSGVLDGRAVWVFGDTLMGVEGKCHICAVDSTGISPDLGRPMHVFDTNMNGSNVANFIPLTPDEQKNGGYSCFSFGGTNIIEIAPNLGICYYLKIHRPGGKVTIHGAGVATVKLEGDSVHAMRFGEKLWTQNEPAWGDVGIMLDPRDNHIYAYGHGPASDKELGVRTFLCRVPKDKAGNVGAYEYWLNGKKQWTKERMTVHGLNGTHKIAHDDSVFQWMVINQANPFWSNYFNCWLLLHGTSFGTSHVIAKTADKLEGPWKDHGVVAETGPRHGEKDGLRYCQVGHPEFDDSGKTVLATWTKNNVIWGATVEWE